jgi:ArsR family transcriptional regulator
VPTPPLLSTCCTPLVAAPLDDDRARALAAVFKALADPNRLRLVSMIQAHEGGTACVCDLTAPLGLSQPTVSHHLRVLREAGIVACEKRGVWAFYRLIPEALPALSALLGGAPLVEPAAVAARAG